MLGKLNGVVFAAVVTGGAAGCTGQNVLNQCKSDFAAVMGQGKEAGSPILCGALGKYEQCLVANAAGCDQVTLQTFKDFETSQRTIMSGTYGYDCLKSVGISTTPELSSGDSGSNSGSEPSVSSASSEGSSGSESALLPWQFILLSLLLCCCLAGIGGGAFYAMQKKGKKSAPKTRQAPPREDWDNVPNQRAEAEPLAPNSPMEQMPSPPPGADVPMATANVDVNGDGIADYRVTGVDANRDGIPDNLQGNPAAPAVIEAVPPMVPIQNTYPDAMPMLQPQVQDQSLFGNVQPLLRPPNAPTNASTYYAGNASNYTTYPGAYAPATTYTGARYTTSTGATTAPYGAAPRTIYTGATPAYASTSYAGGVI